ncbi:Uncharacterized protein OBRU01_03381 [Operophtera brumata]|uniref:Ribosome biogenesis protein NOP53 n=1 Tax=Operophtera brumata TaxID=104452 RepID=A0A0L7LPC8_OPEBR|nr:Uncharacterized protein OBRU01_03381 [Operophtera brumata]
MSIVKKKKHVSKKNKRDWRKHCDIRDVEEFLEDQRLEERLGKFDTKPDSELFVVDTAGNDDPPEIDSKPLSAKLKKRKKLAEGPKCFEILIPDSKVQDPNAKRNHVNPVGFKPTSLSKLTDKRRLEKGVYQRKVEQGRTNRKIARDKKRANKQIHNVLPERRLRARPPGAQTLTRAAIETPHPGEHQELLQDVVTHEQRMIKKQARLYRLTTGMFSRVTAAEQEGQWLEEMSVGLATPHNPAAEPEGSDGEYRAVNPPVRNKKKDHKARRKQKEQLSSIKSSEQKQATVRTKRKEKQAEHDASAPPALNKNKTPVKEPDFVDPATLSGDLRHKQAEHDASAPPALNKNKTPVKEPDFVDPATLSGDLRHKQAEHDASAPPALNKNKTPVKEPDFVDPATLSGDLRHVTTNSNLLRDRFESLQRRGALAASKLMMKKKRKVKSYFKQGHKVTDQDIQRYVNRTAGKK